MPEQTTHTPGPWAVWKGHTQIVAVNDNTINETSYLSGSRGKIADCNHDDLWHLPSEEEAVAQAEANARLIAAAPDLLAACESYLSFRGDLPVLAVSELVRRSDVLEAAMRAAVAKAKGES